MDIQLILAQIGEILRPSSLGDILIYAILILAFLTLMLTPEKNDRPNYILLLVIFVTVIDLLRGSTGNVIPVPGFDDEGFGTLIIHIIMGVAPLLAAGSIRAPQRKGRISIPLALITGIIGSIYAIIAFLDAHYLADPFLYTPVF